MVSATMFQKCSFKKSGFRNVVYQIWRKKNEPFGYVGK
jgi:hypothetical protein